MDRNQLNIVDTINRFHLSNDTPKDAQFGALSPNGDFIQKLYKLKETKVNDGTTHTALVYWSEQGGWYGSEYNPNGVDHDKLKYVKFVEIIG